MKNLFSCIYLIGNTKKRLFTTANSLKAATIRFNNYLKEHYSSGRITTIEVIGDNLYEMTSSQEIFEPVSKYFNL